MMALNDLVDLRFLVESTTLKLGCQPLENYRTLFAAGRNLFEARTLKEVFEHLALPGLTFHVIDQRGHLFGREKPFTRVAQSLSIEPVDVSITFRAHTH